MEPSTILAVLLSLQASYIDRAVPHDERKERLAPVADAIASAASTPLEAGMLLALGSRESAYALDVVEGRCASMPVGQRCDGGHARGPWQVHAWCKTAWDLPDGSPEALVAEAGCAVRLLRYQASRGRSHALSPMHAAFAGYAARPWSWPEAATRVELSKKLAEEIRSASRRRGGPRVGDFGTQKSRTELSDRER